MSESISPTVIDDETFDELIEAYVRQLGRLSALQPEAWREIDLTMTQFRALLFIRARQPLSVSQVAEALQMRLGAASALVNRLARYELVSRRENPRDRRQTLVELTPAGEAMLARVETDAIARARRILSRMSPRGREAWLVAAEEAAHAFSEEETETR
jgi:DNA-binding MarR family transcriptional regulator